LPFCLFTVKRSVDLEYSFVTAVCETADHNSHCWIKPSRKATQP